MEKPTAEQDRLNQKRATLLQKLGTREAPQVTSSSFPTEVAAASLDVDVHKHVGDPDASMVRRRKFCQTMISSNWFGTATGMIICLNSFTIGIEQSLSLAGHNTAAIEVIETFFLLCYIAELAAWFIGFGCACLKCNWVKLDCFFVSMGILTNWVVPLAMSGANDSSLGTLTVLRTMRLLRLARAVRMLYKFKELWILVSGFMASGSTMFYTMVLVTVILYCFSCIGIELITNNPIRSEDGGFDAIADQYFSSLPVTMLSLVQFLSMDSVAGMYTPLIRADGKLVIYFSMLVLIVSIVMMNLITAVIVETALDNTSKSLAEKEAVERDRRKQVVKEVREMLNDVDEDKSGKVSRQELYAAPRAVKDEICKMMQVDELDDAIEELGGMNHDDCISIDDFCTGVVEAAVYDGPIEMHRVIKHTSIMKEHVDIIEANVSKRVNAMEAQLDNICRVLRNTPAQAKSFGDQARISPKCSNNLERAESKTIKASKKKKRGLSKAPSIGEDPTSNIEKKSIG